jgi:hypothetical protein
MAQQMEHGGVPMFVHVAEATYPWIAEQRFVIKEHKILLKGSEIRTYLVSEELSKM